MEICRKFKGSKYPVTPDNPLKRRCQIFSRKTVFHPDTDAAGPAADRSNFLLSEQCVALVEYARVDTLIADNFRASDML